MLREHHSEVMVVGAGPVGMFTALLLSESGVKVRVIDQGPRTTTRTYACALHPRVLKLLDEVGLAREVLAAGRLIDSVGLYEGAGRRAEVKLSRLPVDFPFVVVVSQSILEQLLEEKLMKSDSVAVGWNHQLQTLRTEGGTVGASVDVLGVSAKGYIIPEMEWSVKKTESWRTDYVVGADGPNSRVAQSMEIEYDHFAAPEFYAVYEMETDWECMGEMRIVLSPESTSVLWPLPGKKVRWSFQLCQEHLAEFPGKERSAIEIGDPAAERANRLFVDRLLRERAPWFNAPIKALGWSTDVEFQHRLAKRFGQGRCWLAGDAAHQTSPAGMQSMNMGLIEASQLAQALIGILRKGADSEVLERYHEDRHQEWRRLLGVDSPPKPTSSVDPWVRSNVARILPCLPASGDDLTRLLGQLGLEPA